ncbi:MAG TPA: hypothetical protein VNO30_44255 [Kofleriaceae bacterium]|nr:hypothetical protein [Kofleriaceae bacterium]
MSCMRYVVVAIALCLPLSACGTDAPETEDPIEEPELTGAELALLPDGAADEHEHAEALLVEGANEDDADLFDDDYVVPTFDAPVIDDASAASLGGTAAQGPLLKSGLHPRASDGLRASGVAAWRITQTIGTAPASAGVHLADGSVNGKPYTAAVDISVSSMSATQIHNLLEKLAKVGFAAWYRKSGSDGWSGANHIHAVYANCKMKSALQSQVRSWLVGRNGLVSNTVYRWHTFSAQAKSTVKSKFAQSQSGTTNGGSGFSARINTSGAPLTIRASASSAAAAVGSVPDGAFVTITCQKVGQSITGTYGTTALWDKIGGGYVSDAYVSTGSDGRVAPDCP